MASVGQRRMEALRREFGGKCFACGYTKDLEFAHIRPTKLSGQNWYGRGQNTRYYDIRKNRSCYVLVCRACHDILDNIDRGHVND